jgi:LL-diaminopimelate aminotransferase
MRRRFGLELDPEREILGLIGSKEGLTHLAMAFLDPGDYVLAPSIGYVSYTVGAEMMGARVHYLPMNEGNGFLADFDHVPETVLQRAKILFLNYPNNPTGAIAPVEYLDRAIAFCREHDILLAYDNAYVDITFDGYVAPSILERPGAMDHAVEFLSLSKGYNMTGWRLAFAAGNAAALQALLKVKSNTDSGQFNAVQRAGIVALTGPQDCVEESCSIYQRRRDLVVEALNGMGLWCEPTKGSIYVWAKVPEAYTSSSFTTKMLDEALVVLAPGSGYGPDGEGYVRISLTTPEERIPEALRRMKEVL